MELANNCFTRSAANSGSEVRSWNSFLIIGCLIKENIVSITIILTFFIVSFLTLGSVPAAVEVMHIGSLLVFDGLEYE